MTVAVTVAAETSMNLEAQKQAFKAGFMSQQINGTDLQTELEKYNTTPIEYLSYYRLLEQTQTAPVLVVQYHREFDSLGQLSVTPDMKFKDFSAADYPRASFLKSLLEYNKDFLDLDVLSKASKPATLQLGSN